LLPKTEPAFENRFGVLLDFSILLNAIASRFVLGSVLTIAATLSFAAYSGDCGHGYAFVRDLTPWRDSTRRKVYAVQLSEDIWVVHAMKKST